MVAAPPKTLGQIAFDAGLDVWLGEDTRDDGWDEWEQEDYLTREMWEAGAKAAIREAVPEGSVVVNAAELWAKIEEYGRLKADAAATAETQSVASGRDIEGYASEEAKSIRAMLGLDPLL